VTFTYKFNLVDSGCSGPIKRNVKQMCPYSWFDKAQELSGEGRWDIGYGE